MKRFILSLMLLLPLSMVVAQEVKFAVVKFYDILYIMPEATAVENELMALSQRWQAELQTLENDFNRKQADFTNQRDSLSENIRILRIQEIEDIRTRLENLAQMAQQDTEKKQVELLQPLQDKIINAIEQVGDENNYTMVFMMNPNTILYVGKTAVDITDQVKAKLGIK